MLATAFGWDKRKLSIAASAALALLFGYKHPIQPVTRAGVGFRRAVGVAFASDTASIIGRERGRTRVAPRPARAEHSDRGRFTIPTVVVAGSGRRDRPFG